MALLMLEARIMPN